MIITPLPLYNISEIGLDCYSDLIKNISLASFIEILLVILISYLNNSLSSILGSLNIVIAYLILKTNIIKYINIPLLLNISKV